jgi:membrane-bound ClpP family serine protease
VYGLWAILGIISLLIGVFLYFDQELGRHVHWDWSQLINYETVVSIAFFTGIALIVVAIAEFIYNRVKNRKN